MSVAGLLKNALKPACQRLPALEAWRAYTGGSRPKSMQRQCDRPRAMPGANRAESPVSPGLRGGAKRFTAARGAPPEPSHGGDRPFLVTKLVYSLRSFQR